MSVSLLRADCWKPSLSTDILYAGRQTLVVFRSDMVSAREWGYPAHSFKRLARPLAAVFQEPNADLLATPLAAGLHCS